MDQRFRCPGCGMLYPFNEKLVGKRVKCKQCNTVFSARALPLAASSKVQPGTMPALDDSTGGRLQGEVMDKSLPPFGGAVQQSSAQKSPLPARSGTGTALSPTTSSTTMTKRDHTVLEYGIGLFVVGILIMFGIRFRSRAGRLRDRLTGTSPSPVTPAFQFFGLLMAVAGVGATCFALRRKLHIALPVGAGMLVVLGVSFLWSPLHHSSTPATSQFAAPPASESPPSATPTAPVPPRFNAEPRTGDLSAPPAFPANPPLADQAAVIDLLQRIELPRDAVAGEWTVNQSAVESAGGRSILSFPVKPPKDYRWTVVVCRVKGEGAINLVITVDNRQTMIVLEGFGQQQASGLNVLSGRTADQNETTRRGPIFTTGTPTTVVCTVRGPTISVACDGREIINWSGSATALSLDRRFWARVPPERLAVTIYDSNVLWQVSESTLEQLGTNED